MSYKERGKERNGMTEDYRTKTIRCSRCGHVEVLKWNADKVFSLGEMAHKWLEVGHDELLCQACATDWKNGKYRDYGDTAAKGEDGK